MLHMERRFTRFAVHIRHLSMCSRWFTPTLRVGFIRTNAPWRDVAFVLSQVLGGRAGSCSMPPAFWQDRRVRPAPQLPAYALVVSRAALLFGGEDVSCLFSFPGFALSSFFGTGMGQLVRDNLLGLVSGSL